MTQDQDEFGLNFFRNAHEMWIQPEIGKRQQEGTLPLDFRIIRVLIRLPQNNPPIVEFNDEIGWMVEAKSASEEGFNPGDIVLLHHIREIISVKPPEVDGSSVAFVFIFWNGLNYDGCFDFTPNWPKEDLSDEVEEWQLGKYIANYINQGLAERVITSNSDPASELQKIGLWITPALLPYPLSMILKQIAGQDLLGARTTLAKHCSKEFIRSLTESWFQVTVFEKRRQLIEEVLFAHEQGMYHLAINTLLPQAEGIITDWEYAINIDHASIPFRTESKTKRFRDLVLEPNQTFTYRTIVESTSRFMIDGPVLSTFKQWLDTLDSNFPNRHVIGHGKYESSLYTEENSIKVFLLIDTIFHIIIQSKVS